MKTAKKVLCLTLVLVMALGLAQLASANTYTDYSDGDTVYYTEAVDVLTGINVVEGTDGAYRPLDNVTRAEAAAILTRMLLTRATADNLPITTTGFPDVEMTHWAAKYVAYCSSQAIILGRPDGKFYPTDPVTAAEFAIMIMRALGIGNPARYVGASWAMNAVVDAMDFGILTTSVDYTKASNREEIAVYAFNGLLYSPSGQATERIYGIVGYHIDDVGGTPVVVYEYDWITYNVVAGDSLAKRKYPSLDHNTLGSDDLGRPADQWIFQKSTISIQIAEPIASFSRTVSQNDIYKVTGLGPNPSGSATTPAVEIAAIVNEADGQDATATITSLRLSNNPTNEDIFDVTGNGILTEIYKIGVGNEAKDYKAVIIKPSFSSLDITNTAATATKGAFSTYKINNSNSGVIFTSNVDPAFELDSVVIDGEVSKGDYVLYYMGDRNLYLEAVDVQSGVITSVSSRGTIIMDGESTGYANASIASVSPNKDAQQVYVDSYGYVLGTKSAIDSALRIAMIIDADYYQMLEGNKVVTKYTATIVDTNGTVTEVPADDYYGYIYSGSTVTDTGLVGVVSEYSVNTTTGNYEFSDISYNSTVSVGTFDVRTSNVTNITKGTLLMTVTGGAQVNTASGTTKFFIVNADNTVTIVTGINNFSTMSGLEWTTAVSYAANNGTPNSIADIVFVFDGDKTQGTSEFVFYLGSYESTSDGITVDVHKNGVEGTISGISGGTAGIGQLMRFQLYEKVVVASNGNVTADVFVPKDATTTEPAYGLKGPGTLEYVSGLLFFKGVAEAAADGDVPVYIVTVSGATRTLDATNVVGDLAGTGAIDFLTGDYAYIVRDFLTGDAVAVYVFLQ